MDPMQPNSPSTNTNKMVSAFQLFGPSWEALRLNLMSAVLLWAVPLAFFVGGMFLSLLASANQTTTGAGAVVGILLGFIGVVLLLIAGPAFLVLQLAGVRGKEITAKEAMAQAKPIFWRIWGVIFCQAIVYAISALFLLIPMFFMIRRYMLSAFFVIDQNLGVLEAMRKSAEISKKQPYKSGLWGLVGVNALVGAFDYIPVLGWVANIMYVCAPAVRYDEIRTLEGGVVPKSAAPVAAPSDPMPVM